MRQGGQAQTRIALQRLRSLGCRPSTAIGRNEHSSIAATIVERSLIGLQALVDGYKHGRGLSINTRLANRY
jgi:hypothetical protein